MIEFSCLAAGIIVFAIVHEGLHARKDLRMDLYTNWD
jgi:hypothetical protein